MGKKKAFSKGASKGNPKKSPFKVADTQHQKKPKAVKTKIKKIQAKVKAQQETSDKNLKSLHEQMVVKKPAVVPTPKKTRAAKALRKPAPNTKQVQDDLKKMNVD